ncbi:MAG: hypothetical protein H0X37_09190 [Herpetosiphonaceae bacterium]|nr:hypothetical protein [Herpetosiphonaceae bacterium]
MPTIAMRVPTVVPGVDQLPCGQCYLLFDQARVTLRDLIAAKVQGELRKARAGGAVTTSLPLLLPKGATFGFTPLDEQLAIAQACHAFVAGNYLVVCNGRPLVDLTEAVVLDRRTKLSFIITSSTIVAPAVAEQLEAAA